MASPRPRCHEAATQASAAIRAIMPMRVHRYFLRAGGELQEVSAATCCCCRGTCRNPDRLPSSRVGLGEVGHGRSCKPVRGSRCPQR